MESITFQYPAWYLFGCVLLGLLVAGVLYFRSTTFQDGPKWLNPALAILRFLAVTIIALLLLAPLLKSSFQEVKKPVIVLAQDASESVGSALDSMERQELAASWSSLGNALSDDYELVELAFGEGVRPSSDFTFPDKASNLSEALQYIYDLYSTQNLGAVVMLSDGIYNEGSNPLYQAARLGAPVFTVAVGDTVPKRDLVLKRVFNNQIVYLGDRFSVQVDITALNAAGTTTNMVVAKIENGQARVLQRIPVGIDANDFFATRELILDADQAGVQRYRITLTGIPDEASPANNSRDIFVDVLDARQKILLLAHSPHPDLSALRQALTENQNYELETVYVQDAATLNPAEFDFVILHQLPAGDVQTDRFLQQLDDQKIARLFIVGNQSRTQQLNNLQSVVEILSDGQNTNEVQATINPGFSLFTISDQVRQELPRFPPLVAPFGAFNEGASGQTFLYQRIGRVDTQYPLLVFGEVNGIKTGVLSAEGIWKWRLFDFLQHQNHAIFNELIQKSVQYLSVKEDKRRFRVRPSKNIFDENEAVRLDAELYNESFERINTPDVSLTITDEAGRQFDFTFNKTADSYTIQVGTLPVGDYSYTGRASLDGETLTASGKFSVQPVQLELFQTTADHGLLQLLSQELGGSRVYPEAVTSLADSIQVMGTVKPVIYQSACTRPMIDLKWIFLILIGLLTGEWFLRRYYGGY